jgi:hypothetical protein
LDRDYRITALAYGFPTDKARGVDSRLFPIAKARLRSMAYMMITAIISISGYGWSLAVKSVSMIVSRLS